MPVGPRLQRDITNTTYEELQTLVFSVTQKFSARYNIPFADLIGVAHVIYVKQVERYEPRHGAQISSWIYFKVWCGLMSHVRQRFKNPQMVELDEAPEQSTAAPSFFVADLRAELSSDARTVIGLLLDSRQDFGLLCGWNMGRKRTITRHAMLKTLHEYLSDKGWDGEQIERTFGEIRIALAT